MAWESNDWEERATEGCEKMYEDFKKTNEDVQESVSTNGEAVPDPVPLSKPKEEKGQMDLFS